eukprot:13037509-Ditylum_brightwellii.AAC.1
MEDDKRDSFEGAQRTVLKYIPSIIMSEFQQQQQVLSMETTKLTTAAAKPRQKFDSMLPLI